MTQPYLTPCPKCGVENIDDGLYVCSYCGYVIDTFDEPFTPLQQAQDVV